MKATQMSDWSSAPRQNATIDESIQPTDNAWAEVENENTCSDCTNSLVKITTFKILSLNQRLALTVDNLGANTTSISLPTVSTAFHSVISSTITTVITTQSTTRASIVISSPISSTSTTTSPPNLLANPGAETGTLSPWIIGGSGMPTIDDGTANSGLNPHSGTKQFYGGTISSGSNSTLTQSVALLNSIQGYTAAQLDSGYLSVYISFYEQSLSQWLGTDEGQISLTFRTLNNTLISTDTTPVLSCANNWCANSYSYPLPIGTRRIDYMMIFIWQTGLTIDAYFDDNSLQVY